MRLSAFGLRLSAKIGRVKAGKREPERHRLLDADY
jgi:hypothetical protein